jgi:sulfur carrier protein
VTIKLNGDPFTLDGPATISTLLAHLDIDSRRVAVEHNFIIVKRDQYAATKIAEGDEIEIVNFVGGGGDSVAAASKRRWRIGDQEEP